MKDNKSQSAFKELAELHLKREKVLAYEARARKLMEEEKAYNESIVKGEEAREEGKIRAREEVARALLASGMDIESIAKVTGITKNGLEKSKNQRDHKGFEKITLNDDISPSDLKDLERLEAMREEVHALEDRLKPVIDQIAARREAELRVKEAREKGVREEKESIAQQLLAMGVDLETIAEVTELDKEMIIDMQE